MKRPMIKGSVLHKASVARAEKPVVSQEVSKADSSLVGAAQALGKSNNPNIIDYTLDNVDVDIDKDAKKVDGKKIYESIKDRLKRKRKEKEAPKVEEEIKEEVVTTNEEETEPEIEDNWSEGESDIDKIEDYFPDDNNNVGNTYTTEDNDNYRSVPVDTPKNPNDLRKQTPIGPANEQVTESDPLLREIEDKSEFNATLAPKNFKLKPINIDSKDLQLQKQTRTLDEVMNEQKERKDQRKAADKLTFDKNLNISNEKDLTSDLVDSINEKQSKKIKVQPKSQIEASKIKTIQPKNVPTTDVPDKLDTVDMPAPTETKYAHENPKYAIKRDIEGQSLNLNNERKNTGYSYDYENDQWSFNNMPIAESEVRPADFKGIMTQVNKRQQLESNTPQQYPNTYSPIQKRDDGIWKRAIKGGKVHEGMRKSGYIPPEER